MKKNKNSSQKKYFFHFKNIKFNKKYLVSLGVIFIFALVTSLFISGIFVFKKPDYRKFIDSLKNVYQETNLFVHDNFFFNRLMVEFYPEWTTSTLEEVFTKKNIDNINKIFKCEEINNSSCHHETDIIYKDGKFKDIGGLKCEDKKQTICSPQMEVYQAGKVISGKYKGSSLIYLVLYDNKSSGYPSLYRFLNNGKNIIFFPQYSDEVLEKYENSFSSKNYFLRDEKIIIPELEAPEKIRYSSSYFSLERSNTRRREIFKINPKNLKNNDGKMIEIENDKYYLGNYALSKHLYRMMADGTLERYDFSFDFFVKTDDIGNGHFYGKKAEYHYIIDDIPHSIGVNNFQICENFDLSYNLYCLKKEGKSDYSKMYWKTPFGNFIVFDLKSSEDDFGKAKTVEHIDPHNMLWGKPVIYLYPTKKIDVSVQVQPVGGLTLSEPQYNQGWLVKAKPNGEIYNYTDGKKYPYLFWEGESQKYDIGNQGAIVKKEVVSDFLKMSLSKQGLKKKETDDFMDFWLPRMQTNDYYQIYFMPQIDIDRLAPLTISPEPETVIRVFMIYKGLDEKAETIPQNWVKPERKGFTVIEWGGALH